MKNYWQSWVNWIQRTITPRVSWALLDRIIRKSFPLADGYDYVIVMRNRKTGQPYLSYAGVNTEAGGDSFTNITYQCVQYHRERESQLTNISR